VSPPANVFVNKSSHPMDSIRESDILDSIRESDILDSIRESDILDSIRESDILDSIRESDIFYEISGCMGGIGSSPCTTQSVPVITCRPMCMFMFFLIETSRTLLNKRNIQPPSNPLCSQWPKTKGIPCRGRPL